jgi:hypothetical protein
MSSIPRSQPAPVDRRTDALTLAALLGIVFLFLLPALTLQAPVCYCDSPVESAPRVFAIARIVQAGGVPLWDFDTFAGARPFYVTNESAIFYPLMYPFYLLADLDDARQATVMLILLPFVLHMLWAAAGCYLFGRSAVGLHPAGAFVVGIVYTLSPEMGLQIITPDVGFLFSYLSWCVLAAARLLQTGRTRWWVAGTVLLALMASVGTPNFIIRAYFVVAATTAMLWLARLRSAQGVQLGRIGAAVAMFVVSIGLNGFAWAGVLEGIGWIRSVVPIGYEAAADMWGESSMPPLYLVTLFFPNFYGVLRNSHAWSIALTEGITNVSALSGGVSIVLAATGAVLFWIWRSPRDDNEGSVQRWTWIGFFLVVTSLLTMMGRYTPVFRWLCAVLPWFFAIPHAIYYRFAECWSIALLAGVGVSSLATLPDFERRYGRWWLVLLCAAAGIALAIVALGWGTWFQYGDPAYFYLSELGEWPWFLGEPVLFFTVTVAVLLALFTVVPTRWRGWALAGVIAAETVLWAKPLFYDALLFEQVRPEPDYHLIVQDQRYATIADHPHYQAGLLLRQIWEPERVRFVGYNSRIDNQAWAVDARALLGYSSKPLSPRFQDVAARLTEGMPYDLTLRSKTGDWSSVQTVDDLVGGTFLHNMGVGYVVGNLSASPEWMSQTHGLELHPLPRPLPYAYLQDRVVRLDDKEQLERLYGTDLRRAVYVATDSTAAPTEPEPRTGPLSITEAERFEALQRSKRILSVDQSRPNRNRIEVELTQPAMLVLAETWHPGWSATIDGEPVAVQRVNYLQQGVWLDAGRHDVELRFFPPDMRYGALISGIAAFITAAVAVGAVLRRRRRVDQ